MKTILVPTDFSEDAKHALLYAIEMAQVSNSRIVLFHAFYQPLSFPYGLDFTTVVNELEREKSLELEAYAQEVRLSLLKDFTVQYKSTRASEETSPEKRPLTKRGTHTVEVDKTSVKKAEVEIRSICKFGFAFDEILKAVDVHRADLVIMGMRGGGAIRRALLGRTTLSVMRDVHVPVLAIPLNARYEQFKNIVFAADLSKLPSHLVLDTLREFVKTFDSELQVLHLYKDNLQQQEEYKTMAALETLGDHLYDVDYKVTFQQRDDAAEAIQEFVYIQHADLLVLVPQKHTILEILLNKSLTQRMMVRHFVPVLALPTCSAEELQETSAGLAQAPR
jgi:nucleotide-binding universal stress UspA family protein